MKILLALAFAVISPVLFEMHAAAPPEAAEVAAGPTLDLSPTPFQFIHWNGGIVTIPADIMATAVDTTPSPAPEVKAPGPEPAPWWMRVEEAQALAIKWLGALTVVAGALFAFVMFVIGKMNEIKARVEHQANRSDTQQKQINEIALNVIPPTDQPK